ncbi:transporter substrate-binding domain-containing protein [Halopseudomonas pachastrellae]|nr:transporter substrate-binding domain-containing protein [Halopseudomonas pachastrellae]
MKPTVQLLFAFALLFCGALRADPITVVTEPWPPYVFMQDGQLRGIDYEVSQHILLDLGYQPDWRLMPWKRAQHEVLAGQADAILDITVNPERQSQYHFPAEPSQTASRYCFIAPASPFPTTISRICAACASAYRPATAMATTSSIRPTT